MTHDELIAYIDDSTNGLKHEDLFEKLLANTKALRAVVELHKQVIYNNTNNNTAINECGICKEEPYHSLNASYPCPTIEAIEKELG